MSISRSIWKWRRWQPLLSRPRQRCHLQISTASIKRRASTNIRTARRLPKGNRSASRCRHPGVRRWAINGSATMPTSPARLRPPTPCRPSARPTTGAFRVVVSNAFGDDTSNEATLTVVENQPPTGTITRPRPICSIARATGSATRARPPIPKTARCPPRPSPGGWTSTMTRMTTVYADQNRRPQRQLRHSQNGRDGGQRLVRIHLTVRDSLAMEHSTFRDIFPRTVMLTLATNPSGLQVTLNGQPHTTPTPLKAWWASSARSARRRRRQSAMNICFVGGRTENRGRTTFQRQPQPWPKPTPQSLGVDSSWFLFLTPLPTRNPVEPKKFDVTRAREQAVCAPRTECEPPCEASAGLAVGSGCAEVPVLVPVQYPSGCLSVLLSPDNSTRNPALRLAW